MGQEHIGIDIDYGTHRDTLEVEIGTNDGSYNAEDVGALHSLLSKNGISVDTTGRNYMVLVFHRTKVEHIPLLI